jgi:hypothetical protein
MPLSGTDGRANMKNRQTVFLGEMVDAAAMRGAAKQELRDFLRAE